MEFYSLKELEKIAPSEQHCSSTRWMAEASDEAEQKGIVQQSVKDVIEDLVGDGLVSMDKM